MLRIIDAKNGVPVKFKLEELDINDFRAGQIARSKTTGDILGIIDEYKSHLYGQSHDEEIIVFPNGADIIKELNYPNIVPESFHTTVDIILQAEAGIIEILAGTELNHSSNLNGILDSIKIVINYSYKINEIEENTVTDSQVTVWNINEMIMQTDEYEAGIHYAIGQNLYVSSNKLAWGKNSLTPKSYSYNCPVIATVISPPTKNNNYLLEFKWHKQNKVRWLGSNDGDIYLPSVTDSNYITIGSINYYIDSEATKNDVNKYMNGKCQLDAECDKISFGSFAASVVCSEPLKKEEQVPVILHAVDFKESIIKAMTGKFFILPNYLAEFVKEHTTNGYWMEGEATRRVEYAASCAKALGENFHVWYSRAKTTSDQYGSIYNNINISFVDSFKEFIK